MPVTDSKEDLGNEFPLEISDETIRRFLVGRLSAEEQAAFEEQLMVDDLLEGRVRRAECDLTDDYAFERLSDEERDLFEQKFLVSNGRKQILRTSEALRDRFATASDVTQNVSLRSDPAINLRERLRNLLGLNQPVRKYVLAVLVLIMLIGTIWTVLRTPSIREKFITKGGRPKPAASPVSNQQEAHHAPKPAPPVQEETPLP